MIDVLVHQCGGECPQGLQAAMKLMDPPQHGDRRREHLSPLILHATARDNVNNQRNGNKDRDVAAEGKNEAPVDDELRVAADDDGKADHTHAE